MSRAFRRETPSSDTASNIKVLAKYLNINTSECYLRLEATHSPSLSTTHRFLRSEVYNDPKTLLNFGANRKNIKEIMDKLSLQEDKLEAVFVHSSLGWSSIQSEKIFLAQKSVPTLSIYHGSFDLRPRGTFEKWKETVEDYAMNRTELQMAIILGLSSVVVGFLRTHMDSSLFVNLFGESSSGKTTFAQLAVSTAGNPNNNTRKNGLIMDWGDTDNFKISSLSNNFGVPVVFDELSKANSKNLSEFVYNVANGRSKGRLNSNAEIKNTTSWATTIISTGETSLLSKCNNNSGLLARLIEFNFDNITGSAQAAEKLKNGISKNYGFANTILANYILDNEDIIVEEYNNSRKELEKAVPIKNKLVSRLIKKMAIITTTAKLATNALDLPIDIKGIENLLVEAVAKQNAFHSFDIESSLVEYLLQDIAAHPEKYKREAKNTFDDYEHRNLTALIKKTRRKALSEDESFKYEVIYIPLKFEELLKKGNFTDSVLVLNCLKKLNYLVMDKDHTTVKRKVGSANIRTYVVRFPERLLP